MVEIRNKVTKELIGSGEIVLENKEEIQLHTSSRIYKKKNIILQYIILSIMILCYTNSFSQKVSLSKKSNKKLTKLKIELPKNYKLKFWKNDKIIKEIEFVGVKYFKIERIDNYKLVWENDKKNKTLNLIWFNRLLYFKESRIIDYQDNL